MKKSIIGILIVLAILIKVESHAQDLTPKKSTAGTEDPIPSDSTVLKIKQWQLKPDGIGADTAAVDTVLRKLDTYRTVFNHSRFSHYLGNIGYGGLPVHFFERPQNPDFLFSRYIDAYLPDASDLFFFNTTAPYTAIDYNTSTRSRDKQTINAMHTQNVSPGINGALQIGGHKSDGAYARQNSSKNFYGGSVNALYKHYVLHAAFVHSRMDNMENGGMTLDLSDPEDPLLTPNINSANTSHFKQSALLSHTIKIGDLSDIPDTLNVSIAKSWLDISHVFKMNRQSYVYNEKPASVQEFYKTLHYDSTATYDTTFYSSISNALQFRFSEKWNRYFPLGIQFGIQHEMEMFYNFKHFLETNATNQFSNIKVNAGAYNKASKTYQWQARADYYLSGYHKDDWKIYGMLNLHLLQNTFPVNLKAEAIYEQYTPSFFQQQYYSNHFIWNKDLQKENRQNLRLSLNMPRLQTTLSINSGRYEHYTYFDSTRVPRQYNTPLSAISLKLEQNLQAGHFHLDHQILWQRSDANKILHLPELNYFGSLYYQREFFNILNTQLGINLKYHSSYKLPGYDPATAQFYILNKDASGNMPRGSVFANARWKRALLFLKLEQLNDLLYDDTEYYYTVAQYPMPPLTFTFGVSWKFYD